MRFDPIAIVGQACTLPDALTPQALWANVCAGKNSVSAAPAERWRIARAQAIGTVERSQDRAWSDHGGYVRGFEQVFDASGFALPADEVRSLDPLFQWVLHTAREALRSGQVEGLAGRTGLVMGNLSFPSSEMVRYAESVWLAAQGPDFAGGMARLDRPDARNRFSSGLPAHLAARALGLGRGAFALDAACASSLYAIKLACDRLHDRSADLMVAGAVNRADDLFIHIGFCALSAMSKTGQSRPFHRDADGLVPAEGAGFVVLQRLEDAVASGRKILGVIRGVGLSNDGRGRGLLAPSEEGQERALRLAYAQAGLSPADIGLLECHATGTPVGDATELRSMGRVFEGCTQVPIGSLKSNMGHLITAAGVAGLLKVLAAMEHGQRPPTLHVEQPLEAVKGTPFRLLQQAEAWTGPRRAGVSAFGFGGNNAHLIVEAFDARAPRSASVSQAPAERVAIVGVGARVADGESTRDFAQALFDGTPHREARKTVAVALEGLKFPPNDLTQSLAQQTLVLEAAREAALGLTLPRDRTSVLVGMGGDPEVARYGARWRLGTWAADWGGAVDAAWLEKAKDAFLPVLQAAGVVGTMPNIPANRVNGQLDVAGPSFTVSSEEASGLTALELAARALRAQEIDAALVGAVDLSHELVHRTALEALGEGRPPGDAAVVLVLKRLVDAQRDGNPVFAVLGAEGKPTLSLGDGGEGFDLTSAFGSPHAATGLMQVAAAALALRYGARPRPDAPATPWLGERVAEVSVSVLEAPAATVRLCGEAEAARAPHGLSAPATPWLAEVPARLHIYSGADRAEALAALDVGRESPQGPARLVLVAADAQELKLRGDLARRWLAHGGPVPEGVAFRSSPLGGEAAFVFTGAAAAYPGMGREVALALPGLVSMVEARCDEMAASTEWLYGAGDGTPKHPLDQLWGTSFVCQLHAELTRGVLGLKPQATIGYSSGESNALFAMGAWNDLGAMIRESRASSIFTSDLVGDFAAPKKSWARLGVTGTGWANFSVAVPVAQVQAALASEPLVHLTIVNSPDDCVIGGEAQACDRVVAKLGRERALALGYEMAAHCPEVGEIRDAWWKLHHRDTREVPGVRFYTNATGHSYPPTADAAADAITGQALSTLDFTRTVEQAWADGVRVFIEHGPRALCSGWIRRILGEREHLAVPLDVPGRSGVRQVLNAAASLVAAGLKVDVKALEVRLAAAAPTPRSTGARLTLPAHPPLPKLPAFPVAPRAGSVVQAPPPSLGTAPLSSGATLTHLEAGMQTMQRAPVLPPVLGELIAAPHGTSGAQIQRSRDLATTPSTPLAVSGLAGPSMPGASTPLDVSGLAGSSMTGASTPLDVSGSAGRSMTGASTPLGVSGLAGPSMTGASAQLALNGLAGPLMMGASTPPGVFGHLGAPFTPTPSAQTRAELSAFFTSPAEPSPMDDTLSRFAAHQAQLAQVHRDFLAQQAAVHQRFLALRQATEAALLQAYGSPAGQVVTVMPTHLTGSVSADGRGVSTPPIPQFVPMAPSAPVPPSPAFVPQPGAQPQSTQHAGASVQAIVAAPQHGAAPEPGNPSPSAVPDARVLKPSMQHGSTTPGAASPQAVVHAPAGPLPGPRFDRQQLEVLAGGKISSVFGPEFRGQDGFARQVRMPEPPLLLADRVTGIDATPQSMTLGTLWTETDVRADSWYLNDEGRMPAGVMIEAGQADLLLISYLGVDTHNQGERVYRLLGCELTYHGGLPAPGDTLAYDIHVDGHAQQGDVRLFFFHYDCRVRGEQRLSVRHGQAGFFTDEELANSAGVLWDCASEKFTDGPLDAPQVVCQRTQFSREGLRAFAEGRTYDCFGPGFEFTRTHVRTPKITGGRMLFLDEVTQFDPRGGPWGRGYLRAETPVTPNDWFFDGHFKNDPCMPGTLMFEGCLQAMTVYLTALGFTVERDGWRFEPVPDTKYPMRCRGQVTPQSKHLVYEVFVSEVSAGPIPTVYADLLCTVDGRKAFHAKRVGLRLTPDWPLGHWKTLQAHTDQLDGALVPVRTLGGLKGYVEPKPVATADGFAFDYESLLACAWGAPSKAFGPFYLPFDGTRRVARLPGPPYHFMSRITKLDGPLGGMKTGTTVEVEYDLPSEQWYFAENGNLSMPFCVIMEAALQPCGWLASYVGSARTSEVDLLFRNLDGTGTLHAEIFPASGTFTTKVTLTNISQSAGMIIESFKVECSNGGQKLFTMNTVFGFFPKEAFENQVGLPVTDDERARHLAPATGTIDLTTRPPKYCGGELRLAGQMLLMLDRVTEFSPQGGKAGLGYLRAEKTVSVDEWFFKAHFFQDPVQPGSLGIEALTQLLQFFMLEKGMGKGIAHPRFEAVMVEKPLTWKYRGQVVPKNKLITSEIQITEVGTDEKGPFAIAEGWLWVDGKRIYSAKNLGMRIVPGSAPTPPKKKDSSAEVLDPAKDTWLLDHCPTWTLPAFPMMSMVDRLVAAAQRESGQSVAGLDEVQVLRWLPFPGGPLKLRTEVTGQGNTRTATLLAWREAADAALSRFEPVATAKVRLGAPAAAPRPFAPLTDLLAQPNPYETGALFHGPAFHYLKELRFGATGSTATLNAAHGTVPRGAVHQGLLDAATHAIPHDELSRWSAQISQDQVAYPYRIKQLHLFSPLPDSGELRLETRFVGFDGEQRFPMVDVQVIAGERVLLSLRLVEVLLPKGPLGAAPREARRAFLRDRRYLRDVALSNFDGTTTTLADAVVRQSDWLPGTVARIYGVAPERKAELTQEVAVREHVARRAFVHPSRLQLEPEGVRATMRPLRLHPITLQARGSGVTVADEAPPRQDLAHVKAYWRQRMGIGPWPVEDLYYGLIGRFVGDVVLADPEAFAAIRGRSCLYLGNHQVGVESLLFSVLAAGLSGTPTVTLAKAEHRTSWLGTLIAHSFSYPGVADPKVIRFFEREDKESLIAIVQEMGEELKAGAKSAMVHVEGTRSLNCREPVLKMSSSFIDMALAVNVPIVPVRLVGGLPVEKLEKRLEFPHHYGRQDYWLGRPILPEQLATLPYKDRKQAVLAAINGLGPPLAEETPLPGDPRFGAAVEMWQARTGATHEDAVLYTTLASLDSPGEEVSRLLDGAREGKLTVGPDAKGQWLAALARRLFGPNGPDVAGIV